MRSKLLKYSGYMLLVTLIISACSVNAVNQTNQVNNDTSSIKVSNVKGSDLSINLSFKSFQTKASTDGKPAKTTNDISTVKLYLTTSNSSNPLLASNVKFTSGALSYPTGATTKTYTFSNVPEGTYYVAAELFDSSNNNIIEPLTYTSVITGDTAFGLTNGKRGLTLSSNSVTVTAPDMTYSFSDSATSFDVSPKLLNAIGASIGTTVNTQAGNPISTNDVTAQ